MADKEERKIMARTAKNIQREMEDLIYNPPKCDFEHAWNSAIDKASECCNGYELPQRYTEDDEKDPIV